MDPPGGRWRFAAVVNLDNVSTDGLFEPYGDRRWLEAELSARGVEVHYVSQAAWERAQHGGAGARRRFAAEVLALCPDCSCIFFDAREGFGGRPGIRSAYGERLLAAEAAAVPGRSSGVLLGMDRHTLSCGNGTADPYSYHYGVSVDDAASADALMVYTAKYAAMCPPSVTRKMFLLPQFARNTPSQGVLRSRQESMERRWARPPSVPNPLVIFGAGRSGRDFESLIAGLRDVPGLELRLYTGGLDVPSCDASVNCVVEPAVDRGEFERAMEGALVVAVPLATDAKPGAGLSSLYTAMRRGKVVAITDRGDGLTDGLLTHGQDGFRVPASGGPAAWRLLLERLLVGGAPLLHAMERRTFERAQRSLSRQAVVDKIVGRVMPFCAESRRRTRA